MEQLPLPLYQKFCVKTFSIGKQVQGLHLKRVEHFRAEIISYNPCLM